LEGFQSLQQVVAGAVLRTPARVGFRLQFGQLAMEGEAEPDRGPIALEEGVEFSGRERRRARLARFVHREVGRKQHVAHVFGPGLVIELDQALEFAQDMGVADGVIDRVEPAVRQEVVVHDDASVQIFRDRAAFFDGAIEGEGQARGRVQPLQFAGDAKPRFVEMANLRFGHPDADSETCRSCCAFFPTQATMRAGQISGASKRSLRAWAARSSGRSCWTLR
jgi:hypothetical protein